MIIRLFFISRVKEPFRTFRRAMELLTRKPSLIVRTQDLLRMLQLLPWKVLLPTIWLAQFATQSNHYTPEYKENTARKQSF